MGTLENIHGEKIQPMDGKKIIEQLDKKDPNPKPVKPLLPAEQKEFLSKLNLNVPEDERKLYEQLILQNHDVFSKSKDDLGKANNFKHKIFTKTDEPIFQKQYPILDTHREYLEKQVQEWLKLGIVQPSTSRYNSPMFLVPKKDGGIRVVQDFRALNANSHDDRYCISSTRNGTIRVDVTNGTTRMSGQFSTPCRSSNEWTRKCSSLHQ